MAITIAYGSTNDYYSGTTYYNAVAKIDATHFVLAYTDSSNDGYVRFGAISGTSVGYGIAAVFNEATTFDISIATIDATHFIVSYMDYTNSGYGTAIIGTISGTSISYGSEYVFNSAATTLTDVSLLDSTHFVVSYADNGNSTYGTAIIGTIANDDEISYGSEYVYNSGIVYYPKVATIDSTHFVVAYRDNGNLNYGTAIIGTIANDDEISYGSEYVFNSAFTNEISIALINSTHFIVAYADPTNNQYTTSIIGTIANDDEISYGSEYASSYEGLYHSVDKIDATHFVLAFRDENNNDYATAIIVTIANDDEISYGTRYDYYSAEATRNIVATLSSSHFVVGCVSTTPQGLMAYGTISGLGWANKIMGVAAPAKINGVAVGNIAKVNGI